MLYAIIGLLAIIADQAVKFWVMGHIPLNTEQAVIPGILSLANVHNDGAAFGFLSGSGARIPFIVLAGVFTLAVIIALATNLISGKLARWSIILVTAGALSNCIDRVIYGYVQDMFKLDFFNFPVFNLADVFITVFAIIFALAVIFGKTRRDDDDDYDYDYDDYEEEDEPRISRSKQKKLARRRDRDEDDYEDEDYEDEEDEEPAPKKSSKTRSRTKSKSSGVPKRRRSKEADYDDEEGYEDEEEPVRKPARKAAASKRSSRDEFPEEDDYEDEEPVVTPARRPAPAAAGATQRKTASAEDPFAAWDRASAARAASSASPRPASAAGSASATAAARQQRAGVSAQSQQQTAAASRSAAQTSAPAARRPAPAPSGVASRPAAARPEPAAKPVARPAPKAPASDEFSLDDILNEFR